MSEKNGNEPAFPQPNHLVETDRGKVEARQWMFDSGMTYRQWLAGQALAGISAPYCGYETSRVGSRAVELADAVIAELNKETKK